MEENKFIKAQEIKTKICEIENCIKNYNENKSSFIGICWNEYIQTINNYPHLTFPTPESKLKTFHKIIPIELAPEIIKLLEDKLEQLKEEFKQL